MEFHPLAARYPLLEGDAFESFKSSISSNGQKVKIVLFEGKILDGRNRYRACVELGIDPVYELFRGTSAEAEVYSDVLNLDRRHLNREQIRAVIAYKIKENPERSSRDIAAEMMVSQNTVIAVRKKLSQSGVQVEHLEPDNQQVAIIPKLTGRDGKRYAATRPLKPTQSLVPVLKATGSSAPIAESDSRRVDRVLICQAVAILGDMSDAERAQPVIDDLLGVLGDI